MNLSNDMINGNLVLITIYLFIAIVFIMEVYLYRKYPCRENCPQNRPTQLKKWVKIIKLYMHNGLFIIDLIFLIVILLSSIIDNSTLNFRFIGLFVVLIVVFFMLYFAKRTVFNPKGFESHAVNQEIDCVYHIIAAIVFVLIVPSISLPALTLILAGLGFALVFCFLIVIETIIDPTVLIHHFRNDQKKDAFQLIKGMCVIIFCIWVILYLMVYCCWRSNPDFYYSSTGSIGPLDLLYYMFVSFSTIGFGDVVPVRVDGLFFSRAIAIVISISGFLTTSCFIGAVVSGVSGLTAKSNEEEVSDQEETEKMEDVSQ